MSEQTVNRPFTFPFGVALLHDPRLNKGTAFTEEERDTLGLRGLLPPRALSIDEQLERVTGQVRAKPHDLDRYIYLVGLQDRNETLFYKLVTTHIAELMPIIYTPTVGEACLRFGQIFRRPRGLYISANDSGRVHRLLANWPEPHVDVIVVTDGERILGLGDLGAQGMGIPIGKLALYTACAGVHPARCLPLVVDVGTNNEVLRNDPLYPGILQPRLRGEAYDALIEEFVTAVQKIFPSALLQWEDFATENAQGLLARYRDRLCTFNDDIQGTAAVSVAALLGATRITAKPLSEQRILFFGAGASAAGVADLIAAAMQREGLPVAEAVSRIWLFDSQGLVTSGRERLAAHKRRYAHEHPPATDLAEAIHALKPTALIGLSTIGGAFKEGVLRAMAEHNERPIVFALSNPTSKAECTAEDAYRHSDGRAVFASGSPFPPVELNGRRLESRQANNAYIFPGLGLGTVLCKARRVSDGMFLAAADALAAFVKEEDLAKGAVLPRLESIRAVSASVAMAVMREAESEGLTDQPLPVELQEFVEQSMYRPEYRSYV